MYDAGNLADPIIAESVRNYERVKAADAKWLASARRWRDRTPEQEAAEEAEFQAALDANEAEDLATVQAEVRDALARIAAMSDDDVEIELTKISVDSQEAKMPVLPAGAPGPANAVSAPSIQSAAALKQKTFSPVHYVVPGYVAEGCTILAGRPKVGKSWFMLDVGLAVASGGPVLGTKAEQGDVLYMGLEDNERRLKTRIGKVLGPFVDWPARFQYATEWPRADEGGLDQIRQWLNSVALPRLIVVDVLARFRSPHSRSTAQYDADYSAIQGLQAIASEKRVVVVIVHHLRKSAADSDPFDKVSGTLGLSGAADTVLILDRDGQGTVLYGRGRDIEEIETAVKFNPGKCRWEVLGGAAEVRRSDERKAIVTVLNNAGAPMSPADIANAAHRDRNSVDQLLFKMVRDGEIEKSRRGNYALPTHKNDKIVSTSQQIISPPPY